MPKRRLEVVASADQPVDVVTDVAQVVTQLAASGVAIQDGVLIGLVDLGENDEVAGDRVVGAGGPGVAASALASVTLSGLEVALGLDTVVVQIEGPLVDGVAHANADLVFVVGLVLVGQTTGEAGHELVGGRAAVDVLTNTFTIVATLDVFGDTQGQAKVVDFIGRTTGRVPLGRVAARAACGALVAGVVLAHQVDLEAFQVRRDIADGVAAGLMVTAGQLETLIDVDIKRGSNGIQVEAIKVARLNGTELVAAQAQIAVTHLLAVTVDFVQLRAQLEVTEGGQVGGELLAAAQAETRQHVDKLGAVVLENFAVVIGGGLVTTALDTQRDAAVEVQTGAVLVVNGGGLGSSGDAQGAGDSSR